jgi:DNA-cytosine methyltransferase
MSKNMVSERPAKYEKSLPEPSKVYVVDFFSGCGGMSWGFEHTRQSHLAFEVLGGVDIDANALKTYASNLSGLAVQHDIREIAHNPELLRQLIPRFEPETQHPLVFIGCPPCQGFSAHRKKDERDDARNDLFISFVAICEYYRPDVIVMENVPEFINGRFRHYFETASDRLIEVGYTLTTDIVDLSRYGIPQRRRRAVVLGSLHGYIPLPTPIFDEDQVPTVREAISHLSELEAGAVDPNDPYHRAPVHTQRILNLIRKIPANGGDRRALSPEDQLECHIELENRGSKGFTDVYGRLRWDAPSVTITAKSSTPSCGRFLHPEQHRNISVREAALLQGFPQHFHFEGPFVNQYRQIGEAVPPLFARVLAWQVLNHFSPHLVEVVPVTWKLPQEKARSDNGLGVVDAFCGAGGISLGFEAAGFETLYAFDLDGDAVSTFAKNISPNVQIADVRDPLVVDTIRTVSSSRDFILVGGPPCQGFSQQRRGTNDDPRNDLVLSFAGLLDKLSHKPLAVVLENVTYLDSPRGRKVLELYLGRLEQFGYRVSRYELNSADYGIAQLRRRIVVIALDRRIADHFVSPQPLTAGRWLTIGEVLQNLPEPGHRDDQLWLLPNHEASQEGEANKRRIAFVDMGGGRASIPYELQLECHRTYEGHLDVYGRLDWFSQARTITGGFDSFTRGEYAHPFRHRSITHREAARIQGFPDWFEFVGNRQSTRRQIGNAVPPSMAYAIAYSIKNAVTQSRQQKEFSYGTTATEVRL